MIERTQRRCTACGDEFPVSVKSKKSRCYACSPKAAPRPRKSRLDRSVCLDCSGPTDYWWVGRYSSSLRRCYPCEMAWQRLKYYRKTGGSPRPVGTPRDPRRACRCCTATYLVGAPGSTSGICSPTCRDSLLRDRNRRKNYRRRIARMGNGRAPYKLAEVASRYGNCCHLCSKPVDMRLPGSARMGPTIDHLVPLSDGGADAPENVALAHRTCNIKRGTKGVVQLRLVA